MCLGVPGQIKAISDPARKLAIADVAGIQREINITCIIGEREIEACIGDWVLIHVGFAMSLIDEEEARETLRVLDALGEVEDELGLMRSSGRV